MDIHIQRDGQQMGPYTLELTNEYLAQGSLLATDYAWHEGLPQWVPLNEIAGVVSNQGATSSPSTFNPSIAAAPEKVGSKKLLIFGSIGVAALVTVVLVMVMGRESEEAKTNMSSQLTHAAGDWAQWRGPNRDGVNPEKGLAAEWPEVGPKLLYKSTGVGAGFSSVVISGDTIYTLGDLNDACYLFALDLKGNHKWKSRIGEPKGHRGYPGPRSTPTVTNGHVYALGQYGDLVCVNRSGEEVWRANIENDYGGSMMSGWRWSESPLVDDDKVIITPGGPNGAVLALNARTGEQVWRCKDFTDPAGYSSLIIREIGGIKQYIQLTGKSVAGINAGNGRLLWKADRPGKTAVISTPIYDKGTLFVTSSYGVGCNGFEVSGTGGNFKVKQTYANKSIANHHGGCIRVGDYVYGSSGSVLACLELKTGKEMWNERSAGKGAIVVAGDKIILRTEKGPISMVKLDPNRYEEISRFEQPERSRAKAWAHPVVLDGKLYLRDQDNLFVYDISG